MPNMSFYGSMIRHNTYLIMVSMKISLDHLMLLKYTQLKELVEMAILLEYYAVLPAQENN